jgi:N-acetylmuramoyl-L-alanine amidase
MAKVFIGVGHGGSDPGAVANGFKEKDLNLTVATYVKYTLDRHKVETKMSRVADTSEELNDKIRRCNAFNPNLAIDIHHNAGGGDGAEAFYHYKGGTSKTLAENALAEIVKIGQNSRGAKIKRDAFGRDYYAFIRNTNAPAVIMECAFLDNKTELAIVDTKAEQEKMGLAIAKGILKTLGIAYVEEKPVVTETSGKIYRVQVGAYSVKANAEAMQKKLKAAGFDAIIV